jgi:HSP20 family molecular chaperone IbpA
MQLVPVNVFRTPDRLTVAAPMPGLLPEDISIVVTAENLLMLEGAVRGVPADIQVFHHPAAARRGSAAPRMVEEVRELLLKEWIVGSYTASWSFPRQ